MREMSPKIAIQREFCARAIWRGSLTDPIGDDYARP